MAKNKPETFKSETSPVSRFFTSLPPKTPLSPSPYASTTTEFHSTSILGLETALLCMILDALKVDSSIAESPPPITARGLSLKIGAAPSHTSQAEIPLFQKPPDPSPEPGKFSRFATAPVATITESARTVFVSVMILNGDEESVDGGAKAELLIAAAVHKLHAHDAVWESREVLDVGCGGS
ncbi:hypothetical protein QQP08_002531 [Theobroma cacao]|nr:hypothetical protein QQP08_002531 [Theobroma cacao]